MGSGFQLPASLQGLLKVVYLALAAKRSGLSQSPTLRRINTSSTFIQNMGKVGIYGQSVADAGAGGGSLAAAVDANNALINRNAGSFIEWNVNEGINHGSFSLGSLDIQKTYPAGDYSYLSQPQRVLGGALDAIGRIEAAELFHSSFGDVGWVLTAADATTVPSAYGSTPVEYHPPLDVVRKLRANDIIQVSPPNANGAYPGEALNANGTYKVINVDPLGKIYLTQSATGSSTADWVENGTIVRAGFRQAANPAVGVGFSGMGELAPTYYKRQGAGWTNYINTPFRNVVRGNWQWQTACSYVDMPAGEDILNWLYNVICLGVVNNGDGELQGMVSPFLANAIRQAAIQANNPYAIQLAHDLNLTYGIDSLSGSFNNKRINFDISDPFCPTNLLYLGPRDDIVKFELMNTSALLGQIFTSNDYGKWSFNQIVDTLIMNRPITSQFNINDIIYPLNINRVDGDANLVTDYVLLDLGNFVLRNPDQWLVFDTGVPLTIDNMGTAFEGSVTGPTINIASSNANPVYTKAAT